MTAMARGGADRGRRVGLVPAGHWDREHLLALPYRAPLRGRGGTAW